MEQQQLNRQQVFDLVVVHARKQQCPAIAYDADGEAIGCAYRVDDGTKCFIGALIPDNVYEPSMDRGGGMDAHTLCGQYPRVADLFDPDVRSGLFLLNLQRIHDENPVSVWEEKFAGFAQRYELTYTPPAAAA